MNKIIEINNLLKEFQSGNKEKSYKKLLQILAIEKENLLLRFNIAVIEQQLNLIDEAKLNYEYILRKQDNIKAMVNLYNLNIKEEKFEKTLIIINKILTINNDLEFVSRDKAFVLLKLGKIEECRLICNYFLSKNKNDLDILNIFGLTYLVENKFDESYKIFEDILEQDSKNIKAINSLGRLYHEKRISHKAEEFYLKALNIKSDSYEILNNIAGFYREEGEYTKSIDYYLKAQKINKFNPNILINLAKSYFDLDDFRTSEKYALEAYNIDKNNSEIQRILAFIYLRKQDYKKGWLNHDGRLQTIKFRKEHNLNIKITRLILTKKSLGKNNNLLIMREQGVGDEILYSSIYGDVLIDQSNIKIECDKRLIDLYKRSFNKYENKFFELGEISTNDKELKKINRVVFAGSLGQFYRNSKSKFKKKPFLKADEKKIKEIKSFLNKYNKKFNIGISWRSFKNRYSNEKSLSLINLKNVFEINNCNFINLQYGDVNSEIDEFSKKTGLDIITLPQIDLYNNFDDVAALLKNLDLFLTVSNSTAHLAGALGIKTIVIKPSNHALFHYWNQSNDQTPWYNSIKLIDKHLLKYKNFAEDLLTN